MNKRMCAQRMLVLVAALAILLAPAAAVGALPRPGHYFYGVAVDAAGNPVAAGTPVVARIVGTELTYATTVGAVGRYGVGANTLRVPHDDDETPAKDGAVAGDRIAFYVGGVLAAVYDVKADVWRTDYPFQSGGTTELNLRQGGEQTQRLYLPFVRRG